ncbi:cysteine hydrolase family protein [Spirochaeta cellobiosiphila]|uniref:cysteine hydrolase family protein n=1 Tax=Spirochaeta cellobiosiphila TaxID=504483 RepID=UPI00042A727D|nr:cysteine hydrolase family protein [Spirochaeta cellobiosiphila]
MKKALLIIDVQQALMEESPFKGEEVISNIKTLAELCRKKNIEVIYVQHNDDEDLSKGSTGWQICTAIEPRPSEKIFHKRYNSAFKNTGLKEYLDQKGIQQLLLTGMQTEYCVDTSLKVAFEYGFNIIIPELTNTTISNEYFTGERIYEYYNFKIFDKRFGVVQKLDDIIKDLKIG